MRGDAYPAAGLPLSGTELVDVWQAGKVRQTTLAQIAAGSAFQSSGGSASRTSSARAGDVANVLDYGAGVGGDDALAMRNAIASGKKVIFVPPGTYVCKSTVATYGTATDPSCFEIRGLSDVWILAYGVTFVVDNAISGPTPTTTLSITSNSKHCGVLGARFDGNYTGLSGGAENVAINLASVTGITVRDVKITGTFLAGITGVYIFDSLFDNVQSFKNALGLDLAHTENLTVRGCRFEADPAFPVGGIDHHYDVPTLADNNSTTEAGGARTLRGGISNRLRVLECAFSGFQNSVAIEDMQGALISRCLIKGVSTTGTTGTAGVLLYIGDTALTAGLAHTDTVVENCEITGAGSSGTGSAGGILLGINVTKITLQNNRVFDNLGYGVSATGTTGLALLNDAGSDYATRGGALAQSGAFHPALAPLFARLNLSGAPVVITGSRGGNAALASLLTMLAATGPIIDGTSA